MDFKLKVKFGKILFFILFLIIVLFASAYFVPFDDSALYPEYSKVIVDKNGNIIRQILSKDGYWRFPVKINQVPKELIDSVLFFEDKYFYYHLGINPFSIIRAFFNNITNTKRIGASTISMQVVRMMHPRERTYKAKFIEMFRALQLEMRYSKDEILNFYFNLAPYGGNIEGVAAASWFYFKKSVNELSISESVLLSIIPQHPNKHRPDLYPNIKNKRDKLLTKLYKSGIINRNQYRRSLSENIESNRYKAIFKTPNFTNLSIIQNQNNYIIKTTLDLELQDFVRKTIFNAVLKNNHLNVNNGSAIVIDNKNGNVLAYVGTHNFFDNIHYGQNNGITAFRSPGSVLKPFVYARAIDRGLITPKTLLYDIPMHIDGTKLKNYDEKYRGLVTAEEALQLSLNIPAVDLDMRLGYDGLYGVIKEAGLMTLNNDYKYYGGSLAIGGFGIRLIDIASLYVALANGGKLKKINYILNSNINKTEKLPLFTKQAAYIVLDILSKGYLPIYNRVSSVMKDVPKIAFKTGTSASFRDLWTAGVTPEYTVVAWFGNFNGEKTFGSGIEVATEPVLEIFRELNRKKTLTWFKKPNDILLKKRCISPLNIENCQNFDEDLIIKNVKLENKCNSITAEKLYYLIKYKYITAEDFALSCNRVSLDKLPVIASPRDDAEIIQSELIPKKYRKIPFVCYSFQKDKNIYLFIDDKFINRLNSGEKKMLTIERGEHKIGCMDSGSNFVSIKVVIKE